MFSVAQFIAPKRKAWSHKSCSAKSWTKNLQPKPLVGYACTPNNVKCIRGVRRYAKHPYGLRIESRSFRGVIDDSSFASSTLSAPPARRPRAFRCPRFNKTSFQGQPNKEPPHASNGGNEADTILENEGTPLKERFKVNPVTDIAPKLVRPEPPDIHVVPSFSNDHPHDDSNKTNKVFTDEPCCNDAVVPPPYVKPKDVHNGRQKDQPSDGSAKPTAYVENLQPERRSEIGSIAEQFGNEYTYVRTPRATEDVRLDSWDQEGDTIGPMNRPLYTVPPYLKLKVDNSKHPLLDERRIHGQARSFAAYIAEEQKVEDWNEVERHVNRTPSGRRIHGGRRSTGVAYDADFDEEGSIMDQHITRYGNKRMENESIETVMRSGDAPKSCFVAGRAFSLQSESEAMSAGASSMQGDMHSRQPDFDELAARFFALKKDRNQ